VPLGKSQLQLANRLQWSSVGFVALVSYNVISAMSDELKKTQEDKGDCRGSASGYYYHRPGYCMHTNTRRL